MNCRKHHWAGRKASAHGGVIVELAYCSAILALIVMLSGYTLGSAISTRYTILANSLLSGGGSSTTNGDNVIEVEDCGGNPTTGGPNLQNHSNGGCAVPLP